MASFLLPTSNAAHFHILRVFHQVKQWIGEADNMEAKDWGWSIEHNTSLINRWKAKLTSCTSRCKSCIRQSYAFTSVPVYVPRGNSSSETMDRWGWHYGSNRLGVVYWTQHVRANQIEFATRSRWTSKNDILQRSSKQWSGIEYNHWSIICKIQRKEGLRKDRPSWMLLYLSKRGWYIVYRDQC
jgi:hypothetical protein